MRLLCLGGAIGAVLFLSACSSGSGPETSEKLATVQQGLASNASASSSAEPVDFAHPTSVNTLPLADCAIYPQGAKGDSTRTGRLAADAKGVTRFYPPPSTWGTRLVLDCSLQGRTDTHLVDLNDSSTFYRESDLIDGVSHVIGHRPALTGDLLSPSQDDLHRGGYLPRPDPSSQPDQYAQWVNSVTKPAEQLLWKPVYAPGHSNDPFKGRYTNNATSNFTWSGQVMDANGMNNASPVIGPTYYYQYETSFLIPASTCTAACSSSLWAGVGGFNDPATGPAFFQSGVRVVGNYCSADTGCRPRSPYLWAEYFPAAEVPLTYAGLPFNQGDDIVMAAWGCDVPGNATDTAAPNACFLFENARTAVFSGGTLPRLIGSTFDGPTFELILEKNNLSQQLGDYGSSVGWVEAWDRANNLHTDKTDAWIYMDMNNQTGSSALSCTWNYDNAPGTTCNRNVDTPTQYDVGFSWLGYGP